MKLAVTVLKVLILAAGIQWACWAFILADAHWFAGEWLTARDAFSADMRAAGLMSYILMCISVGLFLSTHKGNGK